MKKEEIFLDLKKLSKEEIKEVWEILKINNECFKTITCGEDTILHYSYNNPNKKYMWFAFSETCLNEIKNKTEINLQQFKELFKKENNINDYIKESFNKLKEVGITFEEAVNAIKLNIPTNLKVGREIEVNGFVLKVDRTIKKWYLFKNKDTNSIAYEFFDSNDLKYYKTEENIELTEITDQEFINQLEKHSL